MSGFEWYDVTVKLAYEAWLVTLFTSLCGRYNITKL